MTTRQQAAAAKAWKTIRKRRRQKLPTLAEIKDRCKRSGGHTFDGPDDPDICIHCRSRRPSARTFARLQLQKWYDDSMCDLWRTVAIGEMRIKARAALRLLMDAPAEPDFTVQKTRWAWFSLVEAAMVDHRMRHPRSRGERPWAFTRGTGRGKASVKCRFCGRELIYDVKLGYDYSVEVAQHVVPCAVAALATGASVDPTHQPKSKYAP